MIRKMPTCKRRTRTNLSTKPIAVAVTIPHESAAPKLMAKFMHPPFADKQCDTCHAPAKNGKVVLTQANVKALCVTCHSDKAELIEKAKVQHPGAAGDCTDCHSPHASRQPGLPKTNAVDICLGCHTDIADLGQEIRASPAGIRVRAAPLATPRTAATTIICCAVKGNGLCLECHGPDAAPQKLEAEHLITIFNGQIKLPEDYFKKNKVVGSAA